LTRDPLREEKQALRGSMRAALAALPDEVRAAQSARVAVHLESLLEPLVRSDAPPVVALFASLPFEIQTAPVDDLLLRRGLGRALPAYGTGELVFHRISGEGSIMDLPRDRLGIPTPSREVPVIPLEACGLVLVPGLAFDDHGFRLGQGGGYYDRALRSLRSATERSPMPRPRCVGICLDPQRVESVPHGPLDEPVDAVCSPSEGVVRMDPP
jgi:5-formyltetrahydrofolate cyclo-ligase